MKPEMKARARELRRAGRTYDEIVTELGVSKSSVSLWVRDLPRPAPKPNRKRNYAPYRARMAKLRREAKEAAAQEIKGLTDQELFVLGVGLYWAEGSKSKPHRIDETVSFVNSDPDVIKVYLAWLDLLGVAPERRGYRVMIHESADVAGAERHWATLVGVEVSALAKTTLKRHNPKTVRKNVGAHYRGCLVVTVRQGADLYRRIEGWWCGIVGAASRDQTLGSRSAVG